MKNLFLAPSTESLNSVISQVKMVVNIVLGLISVAVVFLAIFVGYKFMTADSDDKRKEAKAQLIYAIIGIVIAIGLLIIMNSLNLADMFKVSTG